MKRLLLILACLAALPAGAQTSTCAGFGGVQLFPMMGSYEAVAVSSSAIGFTVANFNPGTGKRAAVAVATLETDSIRFRVDGGTPTSTVGQLVTQASNVSITVCGFQAIRDFLAIRTSGDASLKVMYYSTSQ